MEQVRGVTIKAPVHIGDVVMKNIAGTGKDLVATSNVPKKS